MHETRYTCNRPRAHRLTVSIETQTRRIETIRTWDRPIFNPHDGLNCGWSIQKSRCWRPLRARES